MTREQLAYVLLCSYPRPMVLGDIYAGTWCHWSGFIYDTEFEEWSWGEYDARGWPVLYDEL